MSSPKKEYGKIKNIYLTGFMGSGKSTLGPLVAQLLGIRFSDVDLEIERRSGMKLLKFVEEKGLAVFRELEGFWIRSLAAQSGCVVSLGGGSLLNATSLSLVLCSGCLVYLKAEIPTLMQRLEMELETRPLLRVSPGESLLNRIGILLEERRPAYEQAHLTVEVEGKTAFQLAQEIASKYAAV